MGDGQLEPGQLGGQGSFNELISSLDKGGISRWVARQVESTDRQARFRTDSQILRDRLAKRSGFINPRSSKIQYWDLATAVALLFTAIWTPFEVCVGLETKLNAMYAINWVVNFIFIIDLMVQFVLPVYDYKTKQHIRDHRELAARYLKGWFFLDLFTVIPFDSMTLIAPDLFTGCGAGGSLAVKAIRLIRILRLAKLLRMLRASRMIQRWESRITVSSSTRTMVMGWTGWAIAMHWLACIWLLLPQISASYRDDPAVAAAVGFRVANDTSCMACLCSSDPASDVCRNPCLTPCEIAETAALYGLPEITVRESQSWFCRAASKGWLEPNFSDEHGLMWVFALAKVLGGMGPLGAVNAGESFLLAMNQLAVRISFAILQGLILRVLTTGNPDETKFRQRLDALNYMMADQGISGDVAQNVRDYLSKSKQLVKRAAYYGLIDSTLSKKLRKDVLGQMAGGIFSGVWYLKDCEPEFLEELSHYTTREAFAQGELIPNVSPDGVIRLCILVTGSAARGGAILTSGANWGDLILSSAVLRDTREARALTYCEIISLRRVGLEDLFALYPTSHKIVRECSLKLATQRAMIAIAMYKRANTDAEAGAIASALTSIAEGEGDALEGAPGEAMMAASSPAAADSHNTPPGAKPSPRSLKSIAAKAEGRPTEGVPTPDGALRTPVNKPRLPIGKGKATPASPMAAMSPSQVLHQMNMDRVLSVGAWRVVPEGYLPSPAPGPKEAVTTYTPLPSTVLGSSSLLGGVARTLAGESAAVSSSTRNTPSNRTSRTQRSQRDSHRPGVESGRIGNGSYRRRNSDAVRGGGAEGGGAEGVTPTVMDKLDRLERSVELLLAHAAEEKQRRQDPYGGNPFAA